MPRLCMGLLHVQVEPSEGPSWSGETSEISHTPRHTNSTRVQLPKDQHREQAVLPKRCGLAPHLSLSSAASRLQTVAWSRSLAYIHLLHVRKLTSSLSPSSCHFLTMLSAVIALGWKEMLRVSIAGDEVTNGKPDPEM